MFDRFRTTTPGGDERDGGLGAEAADQERGGVDRADEEQQQLGGDVPQVQGDAEPHQHAHADGDGDARHGLRHGGRAGGAHGLHPERERPR
ncbi:MAG: hypothetical protein R3F59_31915 [Myxococcota bacterium]